MTTLPPDALRVLLVRHGMCEPVGRYLAGRAPGVSLNAQGRVEAGRVAERLSTLRIAAIYSSPIQRAQETAAAIAERHGLTVRTGDAFTELDVGVWTGKSFPELGAPPYADDWRRFNTFRSGTRAGSAELMLDAQTRAVSALLALRGEHAGDTIVVVSHADPIKGIVAYFTGVPLDLSSRLEIAPASVTTLLLDREGVRLLGLNDTGRVGG